MSATAPSTAREVFERSLELLLADNFAGLADLFAADAVLELPFAPEGLPRRVEGQQAIREMLLARAGSSPIRRERFDSVEIHETDDPELIIAETKLRATVRATGNAYTLTDVRVMRVRDGRIALDRGYSDPLTVQAIMSEMSS
jgi:ketosteroid isomerase-like protein